MRRLIVLALVICATPAWADDQIRRLEDSIQRLRDEVEQLKAKQAETEKEVQAQAPSPTAPRLIESPTHQFGMVSPSGENSIAILARLQFDAADYIRTQPEGGTSGVGPGSAGHGLDSGVDARRARLGIGGTFFGDWAYRLIYDFGNSSDSVTTGVSGAVTSGVENAYVTFNGFNKPAYAVPVAVDFGYLDIPWTLEEATSSNDIMFLERASPQVVATQFGGGDFRSGLGLRSNTQRTWAGVYITGPQSGAPHTGANVGNFSSLARASYQVIQDDLMSLHLGANAGHIFNSRVNSTATTATSVATVASNSALALSDRPELRVDPTVILNTGNIPAHSGTVAGLEAVATYGNFFAQGEYFHYFVDQVGRGVNPGDGAVNLASPQLNFDGGYLEASYSFGGKRKYIAETGAYSAVIPDRPFSLQDGGMGALELAARFSAIDLNDHFTAGRAPHLGGGINGGDQKGYDLGLNWYPNVNMRFMLDVIHTHVDNLFKPTTNGAASSTPSGAHVTALAARSQFVF